MGMQEVLNKYDCIKAPNSQKKKKGIITPHPPTPGKMVAFAFLLAFSYYLKST